MDELLALVGVAALVTAGGALLQLSGRGMPSSYPQRMPFFGGGDADTHAWQRYHVRAYSMLLLFIAFEMEMMFMYPWAVVFIAEGGKAMADMGIFLVILALGIVYGWREGIFRWQ